MRLKPVTPKSRPLSIYMYHKRTIQSLLAFSSLSSPPSPDLSAPLLFLSFLLSLPLYLLPFPLSLSIPNPKDRCSKLTCAFAREHPHGHVGVAHSLERCRHHGDVHERRVTRVGGHPVSELRGHHGVTQGQGLGARGAAVGCGN
jgi:hypothetical protein